MVFKSKIFSYSVLVLFCLFVLSLIFTRKINFSKAEASFDQSRWVNIGEGGGGGIWALGFDAADNLWVGSDVGGIYKCSNPLDPQPTFELSGKGMENGLIYEIVGHPTDPNIIYVGTRGGGPYKTIDGGKTWKNMRDKNWQEMSTSFFSVEIDTIALHLKNPEIVWVGIGNSRLHTGGKSLIYISENGMNNWKKIDLSGVLGKNDAIVNKIIFNPVNPDQVFVATTRGFLVTNDNGISWEMRNNGLPQKKTTGQKPDVWDLAINPQWSSDSNTQIIYATLYNIPNNKLISETKGGFMGGIYKSTNLGQNWQPILGDPSLPVGKGVLIQFYQDGETNDSKLSNYKNIIIDPQDPNIIYLQGSSWSGGWGGGVWKTIDGGITWHNKTYYLYNVKLSNDYEYRGWLKDLYYSGTDSDWSLDYAWSLIRHPKQNDYFFYAGGYAFYRSIDKGETFKQISSKQNPEGYFSTTGIEIGGSYIKVDPTDSNYLYMPHGHDNGIFLNDGNGYSWKMYSHKEIGPHGGASDLEIDPKDHNVVYAAIVNQGTQIYEMAKSTDKGHTYNLIHSNLPNAKFKIKDIEIAYINNKKQIYIVGDGENGGVWKSNNDGVSWVNISPTEASVADRNVMQISISPFNPDILHIAIRQRIISADSGIWRSENGGASWTRITPPNETCSDCYLRGFRNAWAIAADLDDPNVVWAGTMGWGAKGGVWKGIKNDTSWNWQLVIDMGHNGCQDIAVDPINHSIIYATGTAKYSADYNLGTGVWRSKDKGTTWEQVNEGLENSRLDVRYITIDPSNNNRVFIGTAGNGAWVREFGGLISLSQIPSITQTSLSPTVISNSCSLKPSGDSDCNDKVDLIDFEIWRQEYYKQKATKKADFNNDGKVDDDDLEIWKKGLK